MGELVVVVTPSTAAITIDGLPVDGNPHTGQYRKDLVHEVGASAPGYEDKSQRVVLAKDPGGDAVAGKVVEEVSRAVVARGRGPSLVRLPAGGARDAVW